MESPREGSGTCTILFTDLVDSSALRARVGEEAADRWAIEAEGRARDLVQTRRGRVVKGTGDGVLAAFDSAADALAAAVAFQQRAAHPMRIGISIGDVTWRQGDCFGQPVVEAARLVAAAGPSEILVADVVRLMARGRGGYRFEPVGNLELKGLPEPLPTARLLWEPLPAEAATHVPLPSPLRTEHGLRFVGRTGELTVLGKALACARAGDRQAVFISGDPGAGKTRLASQFARVAHSEGALVLFGGSDEQVALPYQPVAEALAHLADDVGLDRIRSWAGEGMGDLTRLLPRLGSPMAAGDPETERQRLFLAVTDLARRLAAEQPTVWVLDDLQWSGRPTMLLLYHLLRTAPELRILVIATHRDTEPDRAHPLTELLADLRRLDGMTRVALGGLGLAEVAELAGAEPLARSLVERTGGNPFFVAELLRHLAEGGRTDQVPDSVAEVVRHRLARLPGEVDRVLTTAAVIGLAFEVRVLREAHGGPVDAELESAEQARLIQAAPGPALSYRFPHGLVRAALYEPLLGIRRARLHRTVGAALEKSYPDPGPVLAELAHHWSEAASLGHEGAAVGWCRRAAQQAMRSLSFDDATGHLRRALEVGGEAIDERTRTEVLVELAEALGDGGQPISSLEAAAQAGDLARIHNWDDLLIRAALSFGGHQAIWALNRDRRGRALARWALERSVSGTVSHTRLLAKLASLSVFSVAPADRLAMAADVLAAVEGLEDRTLIQRILRDVTWAFDPYLRGPRWDHALELLASTTDPRDARCVYIMNRCRGNAAVMAGDGEGFRSIVRAGLPILDQLSDADRSILAAQSGHVAIWDGDLVGAERQYEEALQLGRREIRDTAFGNRVFASVLLGWLRGDLSPARSAAADFYAGLGGPNTEAVHMWVELACGNREPAVQFFASFGERHRRIFLTSVICGQGLAAATLASRVLRDREAMRGVETIFAELDFEIYTSGPPPALAVAYYRGILAHGLGDLERAAALLEHSLAVHRRLLAIPYIAASQAALAEVLAQQGRENEARRLAAAALETAERIGAWGIARQARSVLERPA
jgi:class 3 adenylate cyclase/tetratricopeptide (TPR) repeat protein